MAEISPDAVGAGAADAQPAATHAKIAHARNAAHIRLAMNTQAGTDRPSADASGGGTMALHGGRTSYPS
jgi:hypothetical protein